MAWHCTRKCWSGTTKDCDWIGSVIRCGRVDIHVQFAVVHLKVVDFRRRIQLRPLNDDLNSRDAIGGFKFIWTKDCTPFTNWHHNSLKTINKCKDSVLFTLMHPKQYIIFSPFSQIKESSIYFFCLKFFVICSATITKISCCILGDDFHISQAPSTSNFILRINSWTLTSTLAIIIVAITLHPNNFIQQNTIINKKKLCVGK